MTMFAIGAVIPFIILGFYQLSLCKEDDFEWEEEDVFEPEEPKEERRIYFLGLPLVEFDEEEE